MLYCRNCTPGEETCVVAYAVETLRHQHRSGGCGYTREEPKRPLDKLLRQKRGEGGQDELAFVCPAPGVLFYGKKRDGVTVGTHE